MYKKHYNYKLQVLLPCLGEVATLLFAFHKKQMTAWTEG